MEPVGVGVGVLVGVFVGVLVGVLVGVFVGVLVGVFVGVWVGVLPSERTTSGNQMNAVGVNDACALSEFTKPAYTPPARADGTLTRQSVPVMVTSNPLNMRPTIKNAERCIAHSSQNIKSADDYALRSRDVIHHTALLRYGLSANNL
jgi:hypothetical protein